MSITFIEWLQTKNEQADGNTPLGNTLGQGQGQAANQPTNNQQLGNQAGNQTTQPEETPEQKVARISNTAKSHIKIAFDNIKKLDTNSAKLIIDEIMTLIQERSTINRGQAMAVVKNNFTKQQ